MAKRHAGHEQLGARVRRLRSERGLSQDSVSLGAGLDQSGYSKFERGLRDYPSAMLNRIAQALGVPFEELVAGTDYNRSP